MSQKTVKNLSMFVLGFVLLIMGITLILKWWPQVVLVFKGVIGFLLAMIGLLTLYTVKELK